MDFNELSKNKEIVFLDWLKKENKWLRLGEVKLKICVFSPEAKFLSY